MLKVETGNYANSIENVLHCIVQHGPIVGIIHRIHTNLNQSTFIFFWDEYVHEATGFACGIANDNAAHLKAVISMICGCNRNVEGDVIFMIGSSVDKLYQRAKNDNKTMHYIFKPDSIIGEYLMNSIGHKVFETYCQEIYTEDKGEQMLVEIP